MRKKLHSSGDLLADRRYAYGALLARAGEHGAASDLFAQALELAPDWSPAWHALGSARRDASDRAGAIAAFRACLDRDPTDCLGASLELAHLGAAEAKAAPPAYVAALFDAYAAEFDAALGGRLDYAAPAAIARKIAATGRRFARVLDLGCGTGLAGAVLRPFADYLEGVDISAGMIARANEKGAYDALRQADFIAHLNATTQALDLIVAADMFGYVGDLEPVIAAMARRLAPGGLALFTVEKGEGATWEVRRSLRFAHGETYLRRLAAAAGLAVEIEEIVLRKDGGVDIIGLLATLSADAPQAGFARREAARMQEHSAPARAKFMNPEKRQPRVEKYEDLSADLAGTHRLSQSAARHGEISEETAADLALLRRDGYLIVDGLIGAAAFAAARDALLSALGPTGRNDFEGLKTQRAYALLKKTRALDGVVAHPRILALLEAALGPDPLLSALLAIRILPGEKRQVAHFDCGFYPVPRPRRPFGVSAIWALDAFTEENGATIVWPGSHLWDDARRPTDVDAHFSVVMPAGAVVIFDGDLWHAGGANRTQAPRLALTPQYVGNWLRTIENMSLAVPPAVAAELGDDLQRLLGYAIRPPFMGYVDGMHPRRLFDKERSE